MAAAENKTQPTKASVKAFLTALDDPQQQKDCQRLAKLMEKVSGSKPVMWGEMMVGFGNFHYKYASGREGNFYLTGFAPRKQHITLYTNIKVDQSNTLLKSLGKYKLSGSCIHIKKLDDLDLEVLEQLIGYGIERIKIHFPQK